MHNNTIIVCYNLKQHRGQLCISLLEKLNDISLTGAVKKALWLNMHHNIMMTKAFGVNQILQAGCLGKVVDASKRHGDVTSYLHPC